MAKFVHYFTFYFTLFCIGVFVYSIYAWIEKTWLIAPSIFISLILSVGTFILSLVGFSYASNGWGLVRSWLTILLSFALSTTLFFMLLFSSFASWFGGHELIKTVEYPNNKFTIDFIRWDQGATGTFGIRGVLNGPLWFKKQIYNEARVEEVKIEWNGNNIIINGMEIK
ncbi:MAG: DUF5412 family protein [Solibacillus sp.]|uniref:DUF5412 family protein n=1 Tax=Solibacillus sp. TaxID=1909654 RepID=UPI0033157D24